MSASENQEQNLFIEANYALEENLGRPRTVLEIGAWIGQTGQAARRRGARVIGLEMVPSALNRAKDLLDEAYAFDLTADNGLDPVKGQTFDLVILEGVLDRARDSEVLLRRLLPLLNDGGHIVASLSNEDRRDRQTAPAPESGARARGKKLFEATGYEVMRVDLNPRIVRSAATLLGWYTDPQHVVDLKQTLTTPGRYIYSHFLRPIERKVAQTAPEVFAAEIVIVARKPPKPGKLSLTIGMLTLNEKESVERMIDDIRAVAPDAKILLVDSSSDETPELAKAKGARVVRQLPPRGHGPAMERLMYEAAKESEALIYLDCDFTYPTAMIPVIREILESGVDVVNASRTATYPKAMPVPNFLANRFFAATAQAVHGVPTTDVHSGMRGYRASVTRAFSFDGEGDAIPLDTLILPAKSNYKVVEFPIDYSERVGFSKLAKLRGTVWTFLRIASAVGHGKRVHKGSRYELRAKQG